MRDMSLPPYPIGDSPPSIPRVIQTSKDSPKSRIDLLQGWPNPHLLPVSEIRNTSIETFQDSWLCSTSLNYGLYAGPQRLRELIAQWLTQFYQPISRNLPIPAERICVTGGASQNLACILQVFSDPYYTRNVWMVSPTYFLACRIFEDSGFAGKLRSVPEDEEGLDVEYLRTQISQSEASAAFRGVDTELVLFYN